MPDIRLRSVKESKWTNIDNVDPLGQTGHECVDRSRENEKTKKIIFYRPPLGVIRTLSVAWNEENVLLGVRRNTENWYSVRTLPMIENADIEIDTPRT